MEDRYKISDPRLLKVVAHPLRSRLLGLLRTDGPATASELGRRVGESSGSTSYHLRELFKYGFIEEDADQRDGRERRWRARHRYTSCNSRELSATAEGREAVRVMRLRQADVLARAVQEFDEADWPPEWVEAAGVNDHVHELPPAALAEFAARAEELLAELAARHAGDPGARQVHLWVGGFPRVREEREGEA
ncbi:helix-turn-helix domain-containing protein [Nonomuraea aridisoli]|uniref:ArsR family transcriptional regulator n=1 Tax=Nonomuraea aridisoli TaxID=2070368 RepID=A0A2W2DZ07_9ACTN|nr:helix-turn-helix domain-containing protein [Nonomuraea aridisoli]PZG17012.1 ArsR family transcriptional regulator [Nonomuraea aridisoli]